MPGINLFADNGFRVARTAGEEVIRTGYPADGLNHDGKVNRPAS